jgi:hypothetical protein
MSEPRERGATPAVKLAELDSGVHHLREQADMDRRATAARLIEERQHRERMEQAINGTASLLGRVVDLTNRMEVASISQGEALGEIRIELAGARGWIKGVAALAVVAGPLIAEVLRHLFR